MKGLNTKKLYPFVFFVLILILVWASVSAASHNEKRVIIVYKNDVTEQDEDDLEKLGARIDHRYNIISGVAATVDEEDIDDIELDDDVAYVELEQIYHIMLSDSIPQINANDVHAQGGTGTGVKVCIVDTGIDDSHTALPSLVAWEDFINNQPTPYDDHSHGTHVAGTVASSDSTYKGVAPNASLMAAKVCTSTGSCPTTDIVAGIDWCVSNGADIISISLGGGAYTSTCNTATAQAANNAFAQGVFVAAASGNNGFTNAISSPACGSNVVAVGAVDKSDGRTSFSNEGNELDVVAPGVSIVSTTPGNNFGSKTGTSMATPHVSGLAALLLGKDSTLTPTEVRTTIRDTALDLGDPGFDTVYGYGRIDALAAYEAVPTPIPPPLEENQIFTDTVSWSVTGSQNTFILTPQTCPGTDCYLSNIEVNVEIEAVSEESTGTGHVGIDNNDASTFPNNYPVRRNVPPEDRYGPIFTCGSDNPSSYPNTCSLSRSDGFDLTSYTVTLFANSDSDGDTVTRVTQIRYIWTWSAGPLPNQPPVANAGLDQTLSDNDGTGAEVVILDGSASSDPDGTITDYEWAEGATILGTTSVLTTSLSVGVHTIILTVTDNEGATNSDIVVVTVNANQAPVANAGNDQTVMDSDDNGFETVTLNSSASFDSDGVIIAYEWKEDLTVLGTTATLTHSFGIGNHTVTLTVTDNGGLTDSDIVVVTVNAFVNQNPVANAGNDQNVSDNDGTGAEVVTLDGSASFDPDGTITNYEWKKGINVLGISAIINPSLSVGQHTVTLTVTDNKGATDFDTVIITVNANQVPTANAGPDKSASLDEIVNFDGSLSFDPDGSIISYNWDFGDSTSGSGVTTNHAYSTAGTYIVSLTVTDNGGASSIDTATIIVTQDAAPAAPTGLTASADENLIDLSWNANSEPDLAGYNIYRSTSSGGPYTQIASVGLVTTYTDEEIEGTFYYVITAFDQALNESPFSNEVSAEAQD